MKIVLTFIGVILCITFLGCTNGIGDDGESSDELLADPLFPTEEGAKWVYEKTITSSTSGSAQYNETLYLYLELRRYNTETGVYELELTIPIEHTYYYGNPNPPPYDLITYYTITESIFLRNRSDNLEMSTDDGATWNFLYSKNGGASLTFHSFLTTAASVSVSSTAYTGYIGGYPFDPLGQFSGIRTGGNVGGSVEVYEFYCKDIGIIESMVSGQVYSPGIPGLLEGSTTYDVQYVKLLGYRIGEIQAGADPEIIRYGRTSQY